jgi:hypothetical protein
MITSKDVFSKRKTGDIDEAYQMAVELVSQSAHDEWNFKALAWCLIDLVKRDAKLQNVDALNYYAAQLKTIEIPANDKILSEQAMFALALTDENVRIAQQAKQLSKNNQHQEAANLYRQAIQADPDNNELHTSLGWELYRLTKPMFATENIDVYAIKKMLAQYMRLHSERPSLLHSLFLGLADKLIGNANFNLVLFCKMWDLNNLRDEDFEPYVDDGGKSYPSLAEKVIQHSVKQALDNNAYAAIEELLPHLDMAINQAGENIWLKLYKARSLLAIGRAMDALSFAIHVTKSKMNDYWTWELLGDIQLGISNETALSCYCKAMLCKADNKFTVKVRSKIARILINSERYPEAKYEIVRILETKATQGKVSDEISQWQASNWFSSTSTSDDNTSFYLSNVELAETLLFHDLPWLNASLGEVFSLPDKPDRHKRKIYIAFNTTRLPVELSVPENKFPFASLQNGSGLKVKGEMDANQRFKIYHIDKRDSAQWDIFTEQYGVIDHVNNDKKLAHFIASKQIEGVIQFGLFSKRFEVGETVVLKLCTYQSKSGNHHRVLSCTITEKVEDLDVLKSFSEHIRVSDGLGFTENDIFIDRPLVNKFSLANDNIVNGTAVLNYNKKRGTWGWKAIKIEKVMP